MTTGRTLRNMEIVIHSDSNDGISPVHVPCMRYIAAGTGGRSQQRAADPEAPSI